MLTIEKVIELLQAEYEKAQDNVYVYNPLAWALYKVWKIVDSAGPQKITKRTEEALQKMGRAVHNTEKQRDIRGYVRSLQIRYDGYRNRAVAGVPHPPLRGTFLQGKALSECGVDLSE